MRLSPFIFLLFTLILLSCGSENSEEIEALLAKRKEAMETKNLDLYMTLISPDYNVEKDNRQIGIEDIKKTFNTLSVFDVIEITPSQKSIYDKGDITEVVQVAMVEASWDDTKNRFKIVDKIHVQNIDGKWLIVKESDADLLEGFVFGGSK